MLNKSLGVAAAVAATVLLSGCEVGAGYGSAALSLTNDGGIKVAVCVHSDATRVSFSMRERGSGSEWALVAEYVGSHDFRGGDSFKVGEPIEGMRIVNGESIEVADGQEYSLVINGDPERFADWNSVSWIDVENEWLQVSGSKTQEACPAKQP